VKVKIVKFIGPAIALALFCLALRVLHHELGGLRYRDVVQEFANRPVAYVLLAGVFTFLSYFVLTLYDVLALRYVRYALPYYKVAMASFVGYTLSHNLGFPLFTGGAARYRLFSAWGLSTPQIAQALAFSGIIFWVGFTLLGGLLFIWEPPQIPSGYMPLGLSLRPLGWLCLLLVAAYFYFFSYKKKPLRLKEWEFPNPPLALSLGGMIVAAIDWVLAAEVAYVLLPSTTLSHVQFIALFQLGQVLGLVSHVPGGLGVFEAIIVMFLSGQASAGSLAGALVAYRVVYYLVPLACSSLLLVAHEIYVHRRHIAQLAGHIFARVSTFVPQFVSWCLFLSGAMLLFSGATPPVKSRIYWLTAYVPNVVIEGAHIIGSLSGVLLILLARGVQRKLGAAYGFSLALLATGIVASIFKGGDWEEAVILGIVLMLALANREHFYRKASLFSQAFETEWITILVLVLVATGCLLFFAYKHVDFSSELWWEFGLTSYAARSLRATTVAFVSAMLWGVVRVLRSARPEFVPATAGDLEPVVQIVNCSEHSYAGLALMGDKAFLFNEAKNAFLMFGMEGRSAIALGDPVGPPTEAPELIWQFREYCDRRDSFCVFYQVRHDNLPGYLDIGLTLLKIGQEAFVPLESFSLEGEDKSALRGTVGRFKLEGYEMELVPAAEAGCLLPQLREISDCWLSWRNITEKGFNMGFFHSAYPNRFPLVLVRKQGQLAAFAGVLLAAGKKEMSLDLLRYRPSLSDGIMDFVFVELMLWGRKQGYKRFNLGMAPLLAVEDRKLSLLWNKIGTLLFRHGEHFSDFQSILNYKQKFMPDWEPRYLASPGGLRLPDIFADLAGLISGGVRGVFAK